MKENNLHRKVAIFLLLLLLASCSATDDPGVSELRTLVMQQTQTIEQLQATVNALSSRVNSIRPECCNCHTVAFHGELMNPENVTEHRVIIFDNVLLNMGNAYDAASGVFVVPEPGLYLFLLKVTNSMPGNLHCHIMLNGDNAVAEVEAMGDTTQGEYDRASTQVLLQLKTGDRVTAVRSDGSSSVVNPFHTSSFTAVLLKSLQS